MFRSSDKDGGIAQMLAIALPMVVSQSCDTIMILTGRLFLSRLDPELMNACMGGGLTVFMVMSFVIGLTGYSSALVAQYLGAGRKQDCSRVITQAAIIAGLAYIPMLASGPFILWMFEAMGIPPEQLAPQKVYFQITLYAVIISLLRTILGCFFSGIGRTKVIMAASLTAMLVNALLSYVLIFGKWGAPALGIEGAAYATVLGSLSGVLVLAAAYFSPRYWSEFSIARSFRFDAGVMKKLLYFGTPTGLELFLTIIAFNGMVLLFHSHSLATATAATIMLNWDLVSFVPLIGLEIAVTSMVGRFMGAGRPEIAHRSVISGLKIGSVYSAVIFILFVGFPQQLVHVFAPAASNATFSAAFPTALFMIRVASLYVIVESILVVFIGALRGAGDTYWAMAIAVAIHWLMVVVLFAALRVFHLSAEWGWAVVVSTFVLFSLLVYLRYRSGKWRSMKVVEQQAPVPAPEVTFL